MNTTLKKIVLAFLLLNSIHVFAADNTIKITVKTAINNASAIGFTVKEKNSGGLGKSYTGKGPQDQEYAFGYRKGSPFGSNIKCGSLFLSQDSTVLLVSMNDTCVAILA